MVAFALLMTPFATNPLIYVASDPNYRRCPQIDTVATISFRASSIKKSTESLAAPAQKVKHSRAYRDCLCQPFRRNSMAEVEILLATHFYSNPTNARVGQHRPPCEVCGTQWWSWSTRPLQLAPTTSTKLLSPAPEPTPPPAHLSEHPLEILLYSQLNTHLF